MFIAYSPTSPNNKICIDEIKKNPITKGAIPTLNESQKIILYNK